jgi:hypothetical protein
LLDHRDPREAFAAVCFSSRSFLATDCGDALLGNDTAQITGSNELRHPIDA